MNSAEEWPLSEYAHFILFFFLIALEQLYTWSSEQDNLACDTYISVLHHLLFVSLPAEKRTLKNALNFDANDFY